MDPCILEAEEYSLKLDPYEGSEEMNDYILPEGAR